MNESHLWKWAKPLNEFLDGFSTIVCFASAQQQFPEMSSEQGDEITEALIS